MPTIKARLTALEKHQINSPNTLFVFKDGELSKDQMDDIQEAKIIGRPVKIICIIRTEDDIKFNEYISRLAISNSQSRTKG